MYYNQKCNNGRFLGKGEKVYTGNLSAKRDTWQMVFYYYENGKRKAKWESTHLSAKDGKNRKQAQKR